MSVAPWLSKPRPKGAHVVADVRFQHGSDSEQAPCDCRCGWSGVVADFSLHRKEAGQRSHSGQLGVPDVLRGQPSVWNRECRVPKCDRPISAKGYCDGHESRVRRGKSLDTPLRTRVP